MNFKKINGILIFGDLKSFFKFINEYDDELVVKKYEVYNSNNLLICKYIKDEQ